MAYGVPVIATRVGGIPDMVEHGKTGFLVDPGDPEDLACCLRRFLQDENLRKRFSSNSIRRVKAYGWDRVLPLLEQELEKLFSRSSL
jgi:glycosyltransferase involved in cell wall biosynthesis